MRRKLNLILWVTIFLLKSNLFGQNILIKTDLIKSYGFVKLNKNYIYNTTKLDKTFEKLYLQKINNNQSINIIHIGDSHLQADFITSVIRINLQSEFGNAGRGLVVPLKVARTNEPSNYASSSPFIWQSKRCVFPNQPLPIGIGAVTISNDSANSFFNLKIFDSPDLSYAFNKLTLFYLKDSTSFDIQIQDSFGNNIAFLNSMDEGKYPNTSQVNLPQLKNQISIYSIRSQLKQSRSIIFGVSLENNQSGILYHTIGVNGARFKNYTQAQYFCTQTKALAPDLIIISLGTNEANDLNFNEDNFYSEIQSLIIKLKRENPNSDFLLTTPADSYFQTIKSNPRMFSVANTIRCFANDNNIAYWDLHNTTGGKSSAANWKKNKLLRPDGVHYTPEGYKLQGTLFCNAFLNAYNNYVSNRSK